MMDTGQPHDLLPWFASGKLRAAEAEAFRAHLDGCATCREDLSWVHKLKAELDQQGAALLEEHPDPDALVGTLLGEAGPGEAARVRRHLALCATCELEARWVAGEAAVDEPVAVPSSAPGFWTRHAAWGWGLAAAAVLTLAVSLPSALRGPGAAQPPGVFKPAVVVPTLLAEEDRNVFDLGPGDAGVLLVLEVDLPAEAFPVDIEIVASDGEIVHRQAGTGQEYLVRELHMIVPCGRQQCGAGSYVARIRGSAGTDELSFPFAIVEH
jgi:hypothetical protein